jgi:hypothetical protein
MARIRLTADVEPELRRQVKIAAASSDTSVSQWVEDAIRRELDGGARYENGITWPAPGAKPRGSMNPIKLRGGGLMSDAMLEDRGER